MIYALIATQTTFGKSIRPIEIVSIRINLYVSTGVLKYSGGPIKMCILDHLDMWIGVQIVGDECRGSLPLLGLE